MEKTDRYTKRQIEEALRYWRGKLLAEDKAAFKAKFGKEPGFDAAFGKYWDADAIFDLDGSRMSFRSINGDNAHLQGK